MGEFEFSYQLQPNAVRFRSDVGVRRLRAKSKAATGHNTVSFFISGKQPAGVAARELYHMVASSFRVATKGNPNG
jgi:hypothetical protein